MKDDCNVGPTRVRRTRRGASRPRRAGPGRGGRPQRLARDPRRTGHRQDTAARGARRRDERFPRRPPRRDRVRTAHRIRRAAPLAAPLLRRGFAAARPPARCTPHDIRRDRRRAALSPPGGTRGHEPSLGCRPLSSSGLRSGRRAVARPGVARCVRVRRPPARRRRHRVRLRWTRGLRRAEGPRRAHDHPPGGIAARRGPLAARGGPNRPAQLVGRGTDRIRDRRQPARDAGGREAAHGEPAGRAPPPAPATAERARVEHAFRASAGGAPGGDTVAARAGVRDVGRRRLGAVACGRRSGVGHRRAGGGRGGGPPDRLRRRGLPASTHPFGGVCVGRPGAATGLARSAGRRRRR